MHRPPQTLGPYTLLARLGSGGMGDVFAARTEGYGGIQRLCVVKTLKAELADDREYVTRFLDEARVVMQLSHPNICRVSDVGMADGTHYLVMDLVRGRDLRSVWDQLRATGQALAPELAVHIAIEVLDALDYAHRATDARGVPLHLVHRDVSPQNVMLSYEGGVQLIDFGLAKATNKVERTESNVVHGKVAYMAPEQARNEAVDARADVFAVAVMLYELITDDRYYAGVADHHLTAEAANGTHQPRKWRSLDPAMRAILDRAVAPRTDQRTPTAARFAKELRTYASQRDARVDAADVRDLMSDLFADDRQPWHEEPPTDGKRTNTRREQRPAPPASPNDRTRTARADNAPPRNDPVDRTSERGADPARGAAAPHRAPTSRSRARALPPPDAPAQPVVAVLDKTLVLPPPVPEATRTFFHEAPRAGGSGRAAEAATADGRAGARAPAPAPAAPSAATPRRARDPGASLREARKAALIGVLILAAFAVLASFAPWSTHQEAVEEGTPSHPAADAPAVVKLRFLKTVCPKDACVKELADKKATAGFAAELDACVKQCQLPLAETR